MSAQVASGNPERKCAAKTGRGASSTRLPVLAQHIFPGAPATKEAAKPLARWRDLLIRTCRTNAGLTLEKLAELADLSWPYLSEIERGRENISLDKLASLAKALNVSLSKLVENV
jgi:DNA-binding XRE family transcriptional regulator